MNCPDFITLCVEGNCYNPDGGKYGKYRKFYLGNVYCRHLQLELGHEKATWEDRDTLNKDEE